METMVYQQPVMCMEIKAQTGLNRKPNMLEWLKDGGQLGQGWGVVEILQAQGFLNPKRISQERGSSSEQLHSIFLVYIVSQLRLRYHLRRTRNRLWRQRRFNHHKIYPILAISNPYIPLSQFFPPKFLTSSSNRIK